MKFKLSKGMIVLAVLVLLFSYMAVKNIRKGKAVDAKVLNSVTLVSDGKVHSENEGKLVLVSGKLNFGEGIRFDELDSPIKSFKVVRKVSDFISYEKDGKKHYDFKERKEAKSNEAKSLDSLYSVEKTVSTKVGDFYLDKKGMSLAPAGKLYNGQESVCGLKWVGLEYGNPAHKDENQVGDVTVSYKCFDAEKYDSLSVLAMQSGSSFKPYPISAKEEFYKVFEGSISSLDELKAALATDEKKDKRGRFAGVILILVVGVILIADRRRVNAAKEKENN